MFGRGAIRLGIGPHSSVLWTTVMLLRSSCNRLSINLQMLVRMVMIYTGRWYRLITGKAEMVSAGAYRFETIPITDAFVTSTAQLIGATCNYTVSTKKRPPKHA